MRKLFLFHFCLISIFGQAQSNLNKAEFILKWDATRLLNPFNSTVQIGAEFGITESLTIHSDIGFNSNLYNDGYYNQKIIILHNQLRRYKKHGNFWGIDLFYVYAKDHSDFKCLYDKNKKISSDYDNATLIKNAPGLALITGKQMLIENFTIDLFIGGGFRIVTNKVRSANATFHPGMCPTSHYAWHNDRYSGTFPAGHVSAGIKLGYILNIKK